MSKSNDDQDLKDLVEFFNNLSEKSKEIVVEGNYDSKVINEPSRTHPFDTPLSHLRMRIFGVWHKPIDKNPKK